MMVVLRYLRESREDAEKLSESYECIMCCPADLEILGELISCVVMLIEAKADDKAARVTCSWARPEAYR